MESELQRLSPQMEIIMQFFCDYTNFVHTLHAYTLWNEWWGTDPIPSKKGFPFSFHECRYFWPHVKENVTSVGRCAEAACSYILIICSLSAPHLIYNLGLKINPALTVGGLHRETLRTFWRLKTCVLFSSITNVYFSIQPTGVIKAFLIYNE